MHFFITSYIEKKNIAIEPKVITIMESQHNADTMKAFQTHIPFLSMMSAAERRKKRQTS